MIQDGKYYEYCGVIHVHTTDSDGTKTHDEVIEIAQETGLDFLLFNDHMTLKSKGKQGWHDKLLVIVGYEINDKDNHNHFLAYGLDEVLPAELTAHEYVHKVAESGGFGILAHPDEVRVSEKFPPYPWTDWEAKDFHGLEIWNHLSAWTEKIATSKLLWWLIHPRSFLTTPTERVLKLWDEENMRRKVVGIGSIDAHEHRYGFFLLRVLVFPYKVHFNTIRTYIITKKPLSNDFKEAENQFFDILGNCQVFFSNHKLGDASGFNFTASNNNGETIIGEQINYNSELKFRVNLPNIVHKDNSANIEIRLICNGKMVQKTNENNTEFECREPGIYRVELIKDEKGWVYSNHIRVVGA
ncbi:PHP domain-containing protein [bacterium]|nr:PHP domain-containing protein [bacterium]